MAIRPEFGGNRSCRFSELRRRQVWQHIIHSQHSIKAVLRYLFKRGYVRDVKSNIQRPALSFSLRAINCGAANIRSDNSMANRGKSDCLCPNPTGAIQNL
jgi:hypothetical protein